MSDKHEITAHGGHIKWVKNGTLHVDRPFFGAEEVLLRERAELERQNAELRQQLENERIESATLRHGARIATNRAIDMEQQLAASADKTAATVQPHDKAIYWLSVLTKCAFLLNLPDDEPIPSGVLAAVEKLAAAPQPQVAQNEDSRDAESVVDLIVRDVCEMDPANPDLNDTICIDVSDLINIVKHHVAALAQAGKEQSNG
jgi:hypothetical protein